MTNSVSLLNQPSIVLAGTKRRVATAVGSLFGSCLHAGRSEKELETMSKLSAFGRILQGLAEPEPANPDVSILPPGLDPEIPTLSAVIDQAWLADQIRGLSHVPGAGGRPQEVHVKVLKWHKADRCTFEIMWPAGDTWHSMIGKVYAMNREDVYKNMEAIQRSGFSPNAEFTIPQPIAYLASWELVLQEKVRGLAAKDILTLGGPRQRAATAGRCARWLARFHAWGPRSGRILKRGEELELSRPSPQQIAGMGGQLADKAVWLFRRLESALPGLDEAEGRAGHGSFSPEHVILAAGRTSTIDWDGFNLGDPARDVARFIVAVQRLALGRLHSLHALDAAAEVFKRTYLAESRQEVEARLPFFRALTCLNFALRCFNHQVKSWRAKADALLEEGFRILEQPVVKKPSQFCSLSRN